MIRKSHGARAVFGNSLFVGIVGAVSLCALSSQKAAAQTYTDPGGVQGQFCYAFKTVLGSAQTSVLSLRRASVGSAWTTMTSKTGYMATDAPGVWVSTKLICLIKPVSPSGQVGNPELWTWKPGGASGTWEDCGVPANTYPVAMATKPIGGALFAICGDNKLYQINTLSKVWTPISASPALPPLKAVAPCVSFPSASLSNGMFVLDTAGNLIHVRKFPGGWTSKVLQTGSSPNDTIGGSMGGSQTQKVFCVGQDNLTRQYASSGFYPFLHQQNNANSIYTVEGTPVALRDGLMYVREQSSGNIYRLNYNGTTSAWDWSIWYKHASPSAQSPTSIVGNLALEWGGSTMFFRDGQDIYWAKQVNANTVTSLNTP